jgi:hypothetical protein
VCALNSEKPPARLAIVFYRRTYLLVCTIPWEGVEPTVFRVVA